MLRNFVVNVGTMDYHKFHPIKHLVVFVCFSRVLTKAGLHNIYFKEPCV